MRPTPRASCGPTANVFAFIYSHRPGRRRHCKRVALKRVSSPSCAIGISILRTVVIHVPRFGCFIIRFI